MYWQVRFLRNAISGLIPFTENLRKLKRKLPAYPVSVDEWTLEQGIKQIKILRSLGYEIRGKRVMEIGTGWQPIIPLLLSLSGAERIFLIDIQKLLDARAFFSTVNGLVPHLTKISERLRVKRHDLEKASNIQAGKPLSYYLEYFNMEYRAPCDILTAYLPHKSIDLIISRSVLEHIRPHLLRRLFVAFSPLLKNDGRMFHIVDNSDHWEHGDKRISRLNFLKFGERLFSLICSFNRLDYQNRLRHFEYIAMLKASGFQIDFSKSPIDKKALNDLNHLNLSPRFRGIPKEELAILTSYIVSSKAPSY